MTSMRERAAELGGTVEFAAGTRGGTRVRVWLPLADDDVAFRDGLRALLATVEGLEVTGEAGSGEEAVTRAAALQPDVVLMDVKMPGLDGIEATRRIVATSRDIAVLAPTMHDDDESVFAALRAGARGYLLKGAGRAEIVRAIRAEVSGDLPGADGTRERDPRPDRAWHGQPRHRVAGGGAPAGTDVERGRLSWGIPARAGRLDG